jgi:hypothetical protein
VRRGLLALLAVGACDTGATPPGRSSPDWRRTAIPECGASLEMPGRMERHEEPRRVGWRRITYISGTRPNRYLVECSVFDQPLDISPPTVASKLVERLQSEGELGGLSVELVDSGFTDLPDGGTYWLAFADGWRVEGQVFVAGTVVLDVGGGVTQGSPASRERLARILASVHLAAPSTTASP